jgi:hypothetical protein
VIQYIDWIVPPQTSRRNDRDTSVAALGREPGSSRDRGRLAELYQAMGRIDDAGPRISERPQPPGAEIPAP